MSLSLEFCGEWFHIDPGEPFLVGREGPLELDDNQYLHRRFLVISHVDGMWWIENIGARLSATLADAEGVTQAYLQPGARLPLVYADTTLLFTAGRTTYEMRLVNNQPAYVPSAVSETSESGATTIGPIELTNSQLLLVLALSEPVLTGAGGRPPPFRRPRAPPTASAGRSPVSTANSTTSATGSPATACGACTAALRSWPSTEGRASSNTPSPRGSSPPTCFTDWKTQRPTTTPTRPWTPATL